MPETAATHSDRTLALGPPVVPSAGTGSSKMLNALQKLSVDADEVVAATIAILHCLDNPNSRNLVNPEFNAQSVAVVPPCTNQTQQDICGDAELIKGLEKKILEAEEGQRIASISFGKARREMELLSARNSALEKELEESKTEVFRLGNEVSKLNATIAELQVELDKARVAAQANDPDALQAQKAELASTKEKCHEAIETAKKLRMLSEKRKEQRDLLQKERDAVIQERDALQKDLDLSREQSELLKAQSLHVSTAVDEGRSVLDQRIAALKVRFACDRR